VATLLFGFGFALAIPLQREADISSNLISTLPYILTLVAVAGIIGRSIPPAAVGRPYVKQ
jgi:simple sugar transport system permease protein